MAAGRQAGVLFVCLFVSFACLRFLAFRRAVVIVLAAVCKCVVFGGFCGVFRDDDE